MATKIEPDTIDLIIRSRPTILEILNDRGYNVEPYVGISPEEIFTFAISEHQELLNFKVSKKEGSAAPVERARVVYLVAASIRQKIEAQINKFFDDKNPDPINPAEEELIIILSEPPHEAFHIQAAKQWLSKKARINFFQLKNIISNPAKHVMVPPHRKLSPEEVTDLMAGLHLKSTSELPHIKYHMDMQARVLGLVPGDIVEIRRPSETCGEYIYYRKCVI